MHITDFEYDNIRLSDLGYTVCTFSGDDLETLSTGGELEFTTVSTFNGRKWELVSAGYDSCLETTFEICRDPCQSGNEFEISSEMFRYIMRWLHRASFHDFTPYDLHGDRANYHYEGGFTTVNRIESNGVLVGVELTFVTNRPFAIGDKVTYTFVNDNSDWTFELDNPSDEEGYIYPYTEIETYEAGRLEIVSAAEDDRITYIDDCRYVEKITMDYPIISTTVPGHLIQNDFNWNFLRVSRTFSSNHNKFTCSLGAKISLSFNPLIKIGI